MKRIWLGCALLVATGMLRAQTVGEGAGLIGVDEDFKKAFLGSYGVLSDVEPRIGPTERAVLEKVHPLLGTDPVTATQMLVEARTPDSSAIYDFVLGNLALQDDRWEEAEAHYREAVKRLPSYLRAWRNLGLIQAQGQRHDEAILSFTKMIELGGSDATSMGFLAHAYLAKQDYLAAEAAFRQALLLEPGNARWRVGLARCVVKQEKYEEAVALLAVLLEREPERSEFWLMQANAFLGMKQPLRAAENLEMVALLGQATPDTLLLLGDIYLNEGQVDLATNAYVRAIDLDPAQPVARPLLAAEQLSARGAMAQAGAVAGEVRASLGASLTPDELHRLAKLEARIAVAEGDGDQAVRLLEEVVTRDPLDGDALLLVGQHYAQSGDPERAILYLERAAGIDGFEAQAKLRHAQLLVGEARYEQALPLLRRVQEIKPREQVALYLEQVERMARTSR